MRTEDSGLGPTQTGGCGIKTGSPHFVRRVNLKVIITFAKRVVSYDIHSSEQDTSEKECDADQTGRSTSRRRQQQDRQDGCDDGSFATGGERN